MKTCSKCGVDKDLEEFGKDRSKKDGKRADCLKCAAAQSRAWRAKNIAKARESKTLWEKSNPDWHRFNSIKKKYGISKDQYESMHTSQRGVCDICGEPETARFKGKTKALAVDHCHETGEVRSLLCSRCNLMLGKAKDSPDLLDKAAAYLRHHHARLGRDQA